MAKDFLFKELVLETHEKMLGHEATLAGKGIGKRTSWD